MNIAVIRYDQETKRHVNCGGELLGFIAEERPNCTFDSPPVFALYANTDGLILSAPIHSCRVVK